LNKYPPPEEIPSAERQRRLYIQAVKEITALRESVRNENVVTKEYRHDRDGLREELKTAKRSIVTLTRRQKAADECKKAAAWSGGAAICITILYQLWHTIGFPFARNGADKKWQVFWEHEAVYGAMVWIMTVFFAEIYKATNTK
jgi:hypothetical protein